MVEEEKGPQIIALDEILKLGQDEYRTLVFNQFEKLHSFESVKNASADAEIDLRVLWAEHKTVLTDFEELKQLAKAPAKASASVSPAAMELMRADILRLSNEVKEASKRKERPWEALG